MVKPSSIIRGSFRYPDPLWSQDYRWRVIGNYQTLEDFNKFFDTSENYIKTYLAIMNGFGSPNTDMDGIRKHYKTILLDQAYAESQLYKLRGNYG